MPLTEIYFLRKYFPLAPSGSGSIEKDRSAYLLHALCWLWAMVFNAGILIALFFIPKFWVRAIITLVPIDICLLISLLINYKGHFHHASVFFIASLWVMCTYLAVTAGGITAPATWAYFSIIVAAGVLLGARWGFIISILSLASVYAMVWLQMHDLLPPLQVAHTSISRFVMYSVATLLATVMQYLSAWQWQETCDQLTDELNERKKAEAAVKELNESLEIKIAERTAELQEANIALEAFNYSVSHDLQSPMRTVNGYAKILLREYDGQLDDEGRHLLQAMHTNMGRMSQLVRDLLEFSKAGKVALAKESVNMNELVSSIIDEVKMGHGDNNAEIIVHDLDFSVSDSHLIRQVWTNLISNSVKFSGKVSKPLIEIGSLKSKGQSAYYVRDNGAGFDMQYADKLFDPFQRLHSISDFEGTGIGLATVHRIISRHGGKIWAEAKPDEGATFYFTIPA